MPIGLLLKLLPIKFLFKVVLILGLITAGAIGFGVVDSASAQSDSSLTELPFEHSDAVTWESARIEGGQAVLTFDSERAGERVVITDISRQGTGVLPQQERTLERGENTIYVDLVNPDSAGVTVDAEDGRMFKWVSSSGWDLIPDPRSHPLLVGALSGVLFALIMAGLHLLRTKGQTTAQNALDG